MAGISKSHGVTGVVLQKEQYTNKLGTSGTTFLQYIGPKQAIFQLDQEFFIANWATNCYNTQQGGADNSIWCLEATYQGNLSSGGGGTDTSGVQQPLPVWTVGKLVTQQSLFEIDRPIITGLSSDTKARIEVSLKNPSSIAPLTTAANIAQAPNALKVYALAQIGVEGKPLNVRTVKRTITVPDRFISDYTAVNEGKVFSKSALISNYQVDPWIIPLLSDHSPRQTKIDSDTGSNIFSFYGYLEQGNEYQPVGTNTVQVTTDWVYGRYPVDLYDIVE